MNFHSVRHSANRYGSTDTALTPDGALAIETNTGCAFDLMQIATGTGMLTKEILGFVRTAGTTI
ncbi:hypothetical protein [Roseobacter litoralis]|uniref:hypothetical protein n=1 Tax=Roseobacter litoralis TaxID=42443 RepID=UPI0024917C98|nr:hypothetical protein [Roseobacter litoralis]